MFPITIDSEAPEKYQVWKKQIGKYSTFPVVAIRETKMYVIAQYRVPATGRGGELKFSKETQHAVGEDKPTLRRTWGLEEVSR